MEGLELLLPIPITLRRDTLPPRGTRNSMRTATGVNDSRGRTGLPRAAFALE